MHSCKSDATCVALSLAAWVWAWSSLVWALPHPYFSKHPDQARQLETLLGRTSLQALEPQPADLSLVLRDVEGRKYVLERHRGQVLLLTRWATWCSACKGELPFKLRLYQALASEKFAMIGISSEDASTVAGYLAQTHNRYPINLLDPHGLMQKFFPGGAIPVTILIDSWGWVVAMKTGGAQWDTTPYQELMRFLLKLAPNKQKRQALQREKAPAPAVSFPHQIQVKAGQTFRVIFSMRWLGERDKYARMFLRLPKQKGLQVLSVSISGTEQGENHRQYILKMRAEKAGSYTLDPILLTYWLKDYDKHFQVPIGKITVEAAGLLGLSHKGKPRWAFVTLGAAGGLFLLLLLVIGLKKRESRSVAASEETGESAENATKVEALEAALEALAQAYYDELYEDVLSIAQEIRREFLKIEDPKLHELEEQLRYGGGDLPHHQLSLMIEQLYRDVRRTFPDSSRILKALL